MARTDRVAGNRGAFEKNKKKILATQSVCGICHQPVDFSYKFPHPLSPCVDHIIPVVRGGHPYDMSNLQLAHFACNRQKADKLYEKTATPTEADLISNRILPQSCEWSNFRHVQE